MKFGKIRKVISIAAVSALLGVMLTACGSKEESIVSNRVETESSEESEEEVETVKDETEAAPSEVEESAESVSESESAFTEEAVHEGVKAVLDSFEGTVDYINKHAGEKHIIAYGEKHYKANKRDLSKKADHDLTDKIQERAKSDQKKKLRLERSDNGATVDAMVYTNSDSGLIDKIVTTEYGSSGREVTGYYFNEAKLAYVYRYTCNLYGTNVSQARQNGGQRCYFVNDFMTECYKTTKGKNDSVKMGDYDSVNHDLQKEYDDLEQELINRAYITYDEVKEIPAYAKVYGYVSDEEGGMLKDVKVTIKTGAYSYQADSATDGDGYYEFYVPINDADWYNLKFSYGDYVPVEIDDIYIRPYTIDYCAGVAYMAPSGQTKHDTATYLMDVTKQSPDKLKDNQYEVVLTYDTSKADLKPFTLNLSNGKYENSVTQVITVGSDKEYRYFLTDQKGGRNDNKMSYEMSLSGAMVKVYNKNGIVASFQVPAGHAGVVWEVFDINGSEIRPVNNYYFDVGKDIFFE